MQTRVAGMPLVTFASSMEPYNDPLLNTRAGYLQFLSRLYDSGVLAFSGACRGRVGAFCVSKKTQGYQWGRLSIVKD